MTYNGPNNSCPHFDGALSGLDNLSESIRTLVHDQFRDIESEIESARTINATLRDDNIALTTRVEELEEELAEARSQIQALREDS